MISEGEIQYSPESYSQDSLSFFAYLKIKTQADKYFKGIATIQNSSHFSTNGKLAQGREKNNLLSQSDGGIQSPWAPGITQRIWFPASKLNKRTLGSLAGILRQALWHQHSITLETESQEFHHSKSVRFE